MAADEAAEVGDLADVLDVVVEDGGETPDDQLGRAAGHRRFDHSREVGFGEALGDGEAVGRDRLEVTGKRL